MEDREKWESFISGHLADTNKKNTVDLVSRFIGVNELKVQFGILSIFLFQLFKS